MSEFLSLTGEGAGGLAWTLKPVAAHQTAVRISYMAWNPQLPSLLGFVCEDGSLHMADADSQVSVLHQTIVFTHQLSLRPQ